MNHRQRGIAGTLAIALIVAALFYIPWRIESTGDLAWAPFYRNPAMGRSTLNTDTIDTQYVRLKGRPVWGMYASQLIVIGAIGSTVFWLARDREDYS